MRQLGRAVALVTVLMMTGVCFPGRGLAQELKIATVDVEALTLGSDEGKAVQEKLKKRYDEIVAIMTKLQKDIETKEDNLQKQDRIMSATAKAALQRDITNDKTNFDRKNQDYQKEMQDYQNELLDPVAAKAQAMLQAYIKEKTFSLVIDLAAEKGNVVWANQANDITQDVIKRLNDEYKKSLTATPAPAARPAGTTPASGASATPPRTPAAAPATAPKTP